MAKKNLLQGSQQVGEVLRKQRIKVLNKGLREMAKLLDIAPPHVSDMEKGRRTPSEELLLRMVKQYGVDEATLRAGWSRPEEIVSEIASQDATTAAKVPELLRTARRLSSSQWDDLIEQARRMRGRKDNRQGR